MYTFTVTVLLGLALLTLVDALVDVAPGLARGRGLAAIVLAVAGAFALDYSLFEGFGVGLRETWMGTLLTGVVVAGAATMWRAVFHRLGTPEGDQPEAGRPRRPLVSKAA
jgi:hypothetical protein